MAAKGAAVAKALEGRETLESLKAQGTAVNCYSTQALVQDIAVLTVSVGNS
jgi:hypothetical protein